MKKSFSAISRWMIFLVVGMALLMQSCKPSIPGKYLSKGQMEDILYDYHLAEAMARTGNCDDMVSYREAILKKHDVSSADFDSSMVYYMRHTQLLSDIYKNLQERMEDEAKSLGADINSFNRFGNVAQGDTANVWNGNTSLVMSATKPFNYSSFDIPVDSGFHKGDKLMLDFDAQFIFQDGMRDGIAYLAVTFKNDSVATTNVHISGSQHYTLQLEDRDSLGIKAIKGYFLLTNGNYNYDSGSETTLKLMFLQNIEMIRMHPNKVEAKPAVDLDADSAKAKAEPSSPTSAPSPSTSAPSSPSTSAGSQIQATPPGQAGGTTTHEMKQEPLPITPKNGRMPLKLQKMK